MTSANDKFNFREGNFFVSVHVPSTNKKQEATVKTPQPSRPPYRTQIRKYENDKKTILDVQIAF